MRYIYVVYILKNDNVKLAIRNKHEKAMWHDEYKGEIQLYVTDLSHSKTSRQQRLLHSLLSFAWILHEQPNVFSIQYHRTSTNTFAVTKILDRKIRLFRFPTFRNPETTLFPCRQAEAKFLSRITSRFENSRGISLRDPLPRACQKKTRDETGNKNTAWIKQ